MAGKDTRKSGPPKGPYHQPKAVAARKQSRFWQFMAELGPRNVGSAAYRRLPKRGHN